MAPPISPAASAQIQYDLVVIGAGPGGYVAAIRAAQLQWKVALIEKEPQLGGTCLRIGCIPSKALLESTEKYHQLKSSIAAHGLRCSGVEFDLNAMQARKTQIVSILAKGIDGLLHKNKIERVTGQARIAGPGQVSVTRDGTETLLSARFILIATGSKPAPLRGVEFAGDKIGSSSEALAFSEVPRQLIVIGAGAIGLELGSVWARLGAQVTVLEYLDRILPGMDAEIAGEAQKLFAKQGLDFRLKRRVTAARVEHGRCRVECEGEPALEADRVLVAVGRVPNTEGLGAETAGIQLDPKGRIAVDKKFATSVPGIYAIGDVIAGPMLAHKAEEEAVACVEMLTGRYGHVNYDTIPVIVYTHPEVAGVGKTEEELAAAKIEFRKSTFPFRANGRALALGDTAGKVKVLAAAATDRLLGVHIVGPRAGDLIAEAAVALSFGASGEDIARTCHAHPTLSETLKEACLGLDHRAIHL